MKDRKILAIEPELAKEHIELGSNRSFGIVFAIVFSLIALWPLIKGQPLRYWALSLAVAFTMAAIFVPNILRPLNALWFRFGLLLHRVVTPVMMAFVYILAVVPVGWLVRATGKDPLRLKIDQNAATYWLERGQQGPDPRTMSRQY